MSSSEAQNLKAIQDALDQHREKCKAKVTEIQLNPYEVERLGWDDFKGIPIVGSDKVGTGRIKLICDAQHSGPPVDNMSHTKQTPIKAPEREKVTVKP